MSSTSRNRSRAAAMATGLLALVVALGGCAGGEDADSARDQAPSSTPASPSSSAPTSGATESSTGEGGESPSAGESGQGSASPSDGGDGPGVPTDTSPRSYDGPANETSPATVSDVRVGRHETYDRVVIDFTSAGGLPDYEIRWLKKGEQPREPGSGKRITLESNRVLHVRLPSTRDRQPGKHDVKPRLPAVREVRDLGSFEQQTEMYVGVQTFHGSARAVGFRVRRMPGDSPRLVIDVAHADAYARARGG